MRRLAMVGHSHEGPPTDGWVLIGLAAALFAALVLLIEGVTR